MDWPTWPDRVMGRDEASLVANSDSRQAGADVDEPADQRRGKRWEPGVHADVAITNQPDTVDPPDRQWDQRQRELLPCRHSADRPDAPRWCARSWCSPRSASRCTER